MAFYSRRKLEFNLIMGYEIPYLRIIISPPFEPIIPPGFLMGDQNFGGINFSPELKFFPNRKETSDIEKIIHSSGLIIPP